MSNNFSDVTRQAAATDGHFSLEAPIDWLQGRTLYGGLQAALAIGAMQSLESIRPLRCLQTNFIAPLQGTIRGEATVLRSGKNATQIEAKLFSGDTLATQCQGIFGASLPSKVSVQPSPPSLPAQAPVVFPYLAGVTPEFTKHFSIRLLQGSMPFTGKASRRNSYELGLRDAGPVTTLHVAALADVVPPLGLSYLDAPTFGSTMSWMLEFLAEPGADLSAQGWRLDSELVSAEGGYTNQTNTLWSAQGQALALSRQCMLIFG